MAVQATRWISGPGLRVAERRIDKPVVAADELGSSISSGNGLKEVVGLDKLTAANPFVKFHNRERGYVRPRSPVGFPVFSHPQPFCRDNGDDFGMYPIEGAANIVAEGRSPTSLGCRPFHAWSAETTAPPRSGLSRRLVHTMNPNLAVFGNPQPFSSQPFPGGLMSPSEKPAAPTSRPAERDSDRVMQQVVEGYMKRVIGLARKKLSPGLQQKVAPEDIAQSVLRTFFRRYEYKGQFHNLEDSADLWRLLAKLTVTRCHKAYQHWVLTQKRSINHEVHLDTGNQEGNEGGDERHLAAPELTPQDALILRDTLERCFESEGVDTATRDVIECWLGGATFAEIASAEAVKMTPAAVRALCLRFVRAVEAQAKREDEVA